MEPTQPLVVKEKNSSTLVIAAVVIILLLVIGGIYMHKERGAMMNNPSGEQIDDSAYQNSQSTQGSTDDVTSIEADVNATNFDSVDEGL